MSRESFVLNFVQNGLQMGSGGVVEANVVNVEGPSPKLQEQLDGVVQVVRFLAGEVKIQTVGLPFWC